MENEKVIEQMVNNLQVMINSLIEENIKLRKENEFNKRELLITNEMIKARDEVISEMDKTLKGLMPVKVYYSKKRKNTTVIFADGKSVTVHKMEGDKDCLETAIVYALFKRNYPKEILKNLVNTVIKVEENECKKNSEN